MEILSIQELRSGLETAYIDKKLASGESLRPTFVTNNPSEGKKVLQTIEDELLSCSEFRISVAFITDGGITPLLQTLKELEQKGIKGYILTTNYLSFTEPSALERLHSLKNISIKMFDVDAAGFGFHSKGYIFKKEELYSIIVGSSNLTQSALAINKEWNTRFISTNNGEIAEDIINEFDKLWNSKYSLEFDTFFKRYSEQYNIVKHQRRIASQLNPISLAQYKLEPNSMQVGFITNLKDIVLAGENKALLISATGTGKTYAAAFAMRELGYKRVLFLAHRNQLVNQARNSFKTVFGNTLKTGCVAGVEDKEEGFNADYVFATVQSLISNDNFRKFDKEYFDCCILDESHHATADSFRKIIEYFTPEFYLGMTATPDKRDDNLDGKNVYELFDYNIAYEIRLQQAMEEKLLCPFHYFGISDINILCENDSTSNNEIDNFRYLTCDERVRMISKQAEYFGHSGSRVKGLIFCSKICEANELSEKLNAFGYKTRSLSGADSENTRNKAIELLVKEIDTDNPLKNSNGVTQYIGEDYLDYILTVDIFSEGVDIVEVNQVIMLRPTQSPIVFIQQLGRGLRKANDKEYLVVLDFIANYHNNYMIPIALSGDRTYNKDNIRRYLMTGDKIIKGESTIHFDEISRKRIYESIDNVNFSDIKLIKENYLNLKYKLGRVPALIDFDEYAEMDIFRIIDNNSLKSYYQFLVKYEPEYSIRLSETEKSIVEFVSRKLANGKRIQELELLNILLDAFNTNQEFDLLKELKSTLKSKYGKTFSDIQKQNVINVLTNEFPTDSNKSTYKDCVFIQKKDDIGYVIGNHFKEMLLNPNFYRIFKELIDFGIHRYNRDYYDSYQTSDFVLYKKYTYEDVCRLLNWERNEVAQNIGGYKYHKDTNTYPVFINYEKSDDISASIRYADHFEGDDKLIAISKSRRRISSDDVQNFIYSKERGISVHLFVRKNKNDAGSKEFYYLGQMTTDHHHAKEFVMPETNYTAVEIEWTLDNKIPAELYEYITKG